VSSRKNSLTAMSFLLLNAAFLAKITHEKLEVNYVPAAEL